MIQDYSQLVARIAEASGLGKDEIERRIEAKRAKLSGLISKEGSAQIVAAELGINFDKEKMKVSELLSGMKRVNLTGKIIRMFPVRAYDKNGKQGKIGNFIIADSTGNTRVVLWDTNHIELIEKGDIKDGDVVDLLNSSVRNSELHLSGFSDIKLSQEKIENVKTERAYQEKKIVEGKMGDGLKIRAFVVQMFEPRFFEVCPECGKKVEKSAEGSVCQEHGKVAGKRRALINLVLDDGSESIRSVLFSEQVEALGFAEGELEGESFIKKKEDILGKELWFSGIIRQNKLFNNPELIVDGIKEVNIEKLIAQIG